MAVCINSINSLAHYRLPLRGSKAIHRSARHRPRSTLNRLSGPMSADDPGRHEADVRIAFLERARNGAVQTKLTMPLRE
jgi:hypothetical protein